MAKKYADGTPKEPRPPKKGRRQPKVLPLTMGFNDRRKRKKRIVTSMDPSGDISRGNGY